MTPTEFVVWLKGFSQAANSFTLTPKQWDDIKEQLDKVKVDNIKPYWTIEFDDKNSNTTNNIKND